MFSQPSRNALLLRRLAAFALVLWLAGFGCILGCEMNVTAAANAPISEASATEQTESCPMKAGHDCCHQTESAESVAETTIGNLPQRPPNGLPACCPLARQPADPARKVGQPDAPSALVHTGLPVAAHTHRAEKPPAYRVRVPDRGSTHLRCCVFLI